MRAPPFDVLDTKIFRHRATVVFGDFSGRRLQAAASLNARERPHTPQQQRSTAARRHGRPSERAATTASRQRRRRAHGRGLVISVQPGPRARRGGSQTSWRGSPGRMAAHGAAEVLPGAVRRCSAWLCAGAALATCGCLTRRHGRAGCWPPVDGDGAALTVRHGFLRR